MSQAKLELRCIDELVDHAFVIPSYQRGYRWSSVEVNALLDDLDEFRKAKRAERRAPAGQADDPASAGNFYCLQPVVVLPRGTVEDNGKVRKRFELIDGQQRLTTIYLIIRFLQQAHERVRGSYTLSHATRKSRYLDKLDPAHRWESPDSWYMFQAYETIKTWFAADGRGFYATKDIAEVLLLPDKQADFNTKVIWYELPEPAVGSQAEIDAFIRLNAGKIRLTNAELIRALFLKAGNFAPKLRDLSQIKLAQEWDRIEKRLQDDRFWYFLHGGPSPYATRIDHLFRIHLMASLPDALAGIPPKADFRTFLAYQALEKKDKAASATQDTTGRVDAPVSGQWDKVKRLSMRLEEWSQDPVLYHLVGFWIAYQGALGRENASVIVDLLARRETLKQHHRAFEEGIKADIFQELVSSKQALSELDAKKLHKRITKRLDQLEYSPTNRKRNAEVIKPLLLLFNIATLLRNRSATVRFPFDLFRRQQWDIEHIRSVESRRPKKVEDQKRWLATILEYWTGERAGDLVPGESNGMKARAAAISNLISDPSGPVARKLSTALGLPPGRSLDTSATHKPGDDEAAHAEAVARFVARAWMLLATEPFGQDVQERFRELYDEVLAHFGEKEPIEADNSLGNLTLLDSRTNRGYRNAPFPMKRKTVLGLDKTGTFVPRCTTNVFLKYYSRRLGHMLSWTEGCAQSHQEAMATTMAAFFAPGGHRPEEVRHG